MKMRTRLFAPFAILALCGTAIFATLGFGGEDARAPQPAGGAFESADVADTLHRVSIPSGGASIASATAAAKGKKPRIRYFETAPFELPGGLARASELRCPKAGSRVLGGYFGTNFSSSVAETTSAPRNKRTWLEGVTNFSGAPDNTVFIGIVCALGVK
jgi:hypothetical protein